MDATYTNTDWQDLLKLARNDVDGAFAFWVRRHEAGTLVAEDGVALYRLQDDPTELTRRVCAYLAARGDVPPK
jgi:hypothetical protein